MRSSTKCTGIILFIALLVNQGESEIRINIEPEDFTGFMANFRSLRYTVQGDGITKYQWYHNGSSIEGKSKLQFWGQTKSDLNIFEVTLSYQGIYQLYITSTLGRIFGREIKVEFTVVGQFKAKKPKKLDVVIGQTFRIACPAHSFTRNTVYKWGRTDTHQGTWFYEPSDNAMVLHDGTLFFSQVTEDDALRIIEKNGIKCLLDGNYEKNTKIESSSIFQLNIVGTNKTSFGPVIEKIPNKEVLQGKFVLLKCIAAGYPTPTYRWEMTDKNGVTKKVFNHVDGIELSYKNKLLTIKLIRKDHAGVYKCYATIEENGTRKEVVEQSTLTVRERPQWVVGRDIKSATPEIFSQHAWMCIAKGDPEPVYHWYANATIMKNQSGRHTIEGGILTFHRVIQEDNGMYQCVAKNKFGFQYQTVSMIVKVKHPTIIKLDRQTTLMVDTRGIISCRSEAIPDAVHHWLKNGVKLEINTTEKYELGDNMQDMVINNVTKEDAGNYTCIASNMIGRETGYIVVSIGEIMFKKRPINKKNVTKGEQFSLSCEADSDPPLDISYKWIFQGQKVKLAGGRHLWAADTHTLFLLNSEISDSGTYECVAYVKQPTYVEKIASAIVIVRGVPDPPENLTLQGTCSNFETKLSWKIRYRSPYVLLTRLLIEWRSSHEGTTWHNISEQVDVASETQVIRGLNPWSDIRFRIIAVNKYGRSRPSSATDGNKCKTPASKPTKCPENVAGNATKPQTIEITWKKVPATYENGPAFSYIVSYREPNSTWQRETVGKEAQPRFTMDKAGHDQQWEITVQSNNSEGVGPECPVQSVRSIKAAPTLPPQSFTYKTIGPRYVILSWEPMAGVSEEAVLGYKISYWRKKDSNTKQRRSQNQQQPSCGEEDKPCEVFVEGGAKKEHKVDGLLPYQTYTMTLRAYNKGGDGPRSQPLVFDTREDTPGPPYRIRFTTFGKYIEVKWKPPQQPNGVITGYITEVEGAESTDEPAVELDENIMEYLFGDLVPQREYKVFITAKTSAGPGETVVKLVKTTAIRAPVVPKAPGVQGLTKNSVNVTFNPGDGEGGFPERFYVMYREKGQEDDDNLKKTNETWLTKDDGKSHIVVGGLDRHKTYLFTTVVVNGDKKSDMSEFTPGGPITAPELVYHHTPFYRRHWFYITIGILVLLLLLMLILMIIRRRKPRQTYKVSERERKHGQKESFVEMADEHPLTRVESDDEALKVKGRTYDAIEPKMEKGSEPNLEINPEKDSLDDYDGEDDDFSEHGSFIGQYGPGKRNSASQSSLPAFV